MGKRSDRDQALRRLAEQNTPEGAAARRMLTNPPKFKDRERPAQPLQESASARAHAKGFRGFGLNMSDFTFAMRATSGSAKDMKDAVEAMAAALGIGKCPNCGAPTFHNKPCGLCAAGYGPKPKQRRGYCWNCTQPLGGHAICPTCNVYNEGA